MARLQGKVALITGGAMGLGEAQARLFIQEGAKVIITDLAEDAGRKTAADLGANCLFIKQDVSNPDAWAAVVEEGTKAFGPITVLVNNAGIAGPYATTTALSIEDYLKVMGVNVNGVFFGMRAVIPGMIKAGGGSIVNISSIAGFAHGDHSTNAAYTSSKFAVRGLTKAAATEYARDKVRVNSVHPGGVVTPMVRANTPQEHIDAFAAALPMGRTGEPHEIANVVLFLASDESSYMTAAALIADGGKLR